MSAPSPSSTGATPTLIQRKSGYIGVVAALMFTGLLTIGLYARVALSEAPPERTVLTVSTVPFQLIGSYRRSSAYLGLVTAGRKANLGFEVPGLIDTPPLREGSPVQAGDVVATLDQAAVKSRRKATAANLEQARAELELAQLRAQRQKGLRETGAVSKQTYDESRLTAQAAQSRVDAVTAQLASIDIEIAKSQLLAPYDGVVADRYVHQGAVVNPGTPVVRLIETANQEAHIGVTARRAVELVVGESYTLNLRDQAFEATLLSVRPDVDPITRSTTAVFNIPASNHALDGEPVTLKLEETVVAAGGWLPISALQEGSRGVWTALRLVAEGSNYRTVKEAVEVLDVRGENAFVRGSLTDGALLVASGVHRISSGTRVTLQRGQ